MPRRRKSTTPNKTTSVAITNSKPSYQAASTKKKSVQSYQADAKQSASNSNLAAKSTDRSRSGNSADQDKSNSEVSNYIAEFRDFVSCL